MFPLQTNVVTALSLSHKYCLGFAFRAQSLEYASHPQLITSIVTTFDATGMAAMADTPEGGGAPGEVGERLLELVLSTTAEASGMQEVARVSQRGLVVAPSKIVQTKYARSTATWAVALGRRYILLIRPQGPSVRFCGANISAVLGER